VASSMINRISVHFSSTKLLLMLFFGLLRNYITNNLVFDWEKEKYISHLYKVAEL